MLISPRLINSLLIVQLTCAVAFAQERRPAPKLQPASAPITVAASGANVRFTAVGAVERMRLEVFDASGVPVFDTGFKPGNVSDWGLRGSLGQQLPDSTYLCVVTVKELSGRLSFKQGSVLLQSGQASLALDGGGQPERIDLEPEQSLSTRTVSDIPAMAVVAHDGEVGQVTSTSGPLTFRTGDIFTGKDKEHVRVMANGRVGIGTKNPQATLDVAGVIRTGKGIRFPDGSVLTSAGTARGKTPLAADANGTEAEEPPTTDVSGTGTTGKIVKWTNGATGALGDSVVTESAGGNIGIGTATPNNKLHVVGSVELGASAGGGVNPTIVNPNNIGNFAQVQFYPGSGTNVNTSFAVVPKGTGVSTNRAQFTVFNTDFIANATNYEFASLRARGSDFVFGTGKNGSGLNRPLMFSAGFLTNNLTNNNQLYLATNGTVGIGTDNPIARLSILNSLGGTTLYADNQGSSGTGASFQMSNASNPDNAVQVATVGTGRAGLFEILNANSTNAALRAETNSEVGPAAEFVNTDSVVANGAGIGVRALSSGGLASDIHPSGNYYTAAGEFAGANGVIGAAAATSPDGVGVLGLVGSSGGTGSGSIYGLNKGLGRAAYFLIENPSNSKAVLLTESTGTGFAAEFKGYGSAKGVYIESGIGQKGLEVNRGRIILSYAAVAGGTTIPSDVAVVGVSNNGVAANVPSVALPASAEDGAVIVVGTTDPDGAEITGASGGPHTVTANNSRRFTRILGAWKSEF